MSAYLNTIIQRLRWDLDTPLKQSDGGFVSRKLRCKYNYNEDIRLTDSSVEISRQICDDYIVSHQLEIYDFSGNITKSKCGINDDIIPIIRDRTIESLEARALRMYRMNSGLPFRPTYIAEALEIFSNDIIRLNVPVSFTA